MPKYNPSDDEMPSYPGEEAGAGTMPKEGAPEEEAKESVDQEEAEGATAVIANKVLSPEGEPLKPGDEIVLRVVKNYGEESEVEYAPKEGGGAVEPPGGGMAGAEAELDMMGKE